MSEYVLAGPHLFEVTVGSALIIVSILFLLFASPKPMSGRLSGMPTEDLFKRFARWTGYFQRVLGCCSRPCPRVTERNRQSRFSPRRLPQVRFHHVSGFDHRCHRPASALSSLGEGSS